MPKINVYLPDALAEAVKEAQLPVSSICQAALESAVQKVLAAHDGRLYSRFTPRAKHVLKLRAELARRSPTSTSTRSTCWSASSTKAATSASRCCSRSTSSPPTSARSSWARCLRRPPPSSTTRKGDDPHARAHCERGDGARAQLHRVRAPPPRRAHDRRHDGRTGIPPDGRRRAFCSARGGLSAGRLRPRDGADDADTTAGDRHQPRRDPAPASRRSSSASGASERQCTTSERALRRRRAVQGDRPPRSPREVERVHVRDGRRDSIRDRRGGVRPKGGRERGDRERPRTSAQGSTREIWLARPQAIQPHQPARARTPRSSRRCSATSSGCRSR